jgi:hypothetical protein
VVPTSAAAAAVSLLPAAAWVHPPTQEALLSRLEGGSVAAPVLLHKSVRSLSLKRVMTHINNVLQAQVQCQGEIARVNQHSALGRMCSQAELGLLCSKY